MARAAKSSAPAAVSSKSAAPKSAAKPAASKALARAAGIPSQPPGASVGVSNALRALDNDRRLQIFEWLKSPTEHFRPQVDGDLVLDGVCGALIAEKLGVSQPTLSEHMRLLVGSGLVSAKRIKQWTFYKRDERTIAAFMRALRDL